MGTIEPTKFLGNSASHDTKLRQIKDRLHQVLSKIHVQMEACKSEHDLLMAESHARSAVCILELSSSSNDQRTLPILSKINLPNNTRLPTQRFFSTRKRRKQLTTRLTKPSAKQKTALLKQLSENYSLYNKEITIKR